MKQKRTPLRTRLASLLVIASERLSNASSEIAGMPKESNIYLAFERALDKIERCKYKKLNSNALRRDEPDYLIIIRSRAIFIEFKIPGKDARQGQRIRLRWWAKSDARCAVCDNLDAALRIVREEERIALRHAGYDEIN